jgi:hypothetical protein
MNTVLVMAHCYCYCRILPVSWTFSVFRTCEEFLTENGILVKDFNVILTDQHFGESCQNGTQLTSTLRNLYSFRHLIIGISGDEVSGEFMLAGANLFWSKPPPPNASILEQLVQHRDLLIPLRQTKPMFSSFGSRDDRVDC